VSDALGFERRLLALQDQWRQSLTPVRAGSATELLIDTLPGAPILTVASATKLLGRSKQAVNVAIGRLVAAGVLHQINVGRRRNRAFEAVTVIDAFTDLERQLASPGGDTLNSPPARPVPRRRTGS
jgi:hypothetical protein